MGGVNTLTGKFPYIVAIHICTNRRQQVLLRRNALQPGVGPHFRALRLQVLSCLKSGKNSHFDKFSAILFTIQLGSAKLEGEDPSRETVATSEYIIHPDFNPNTITNDIGLIKFRMPIQYTGECSFCKFYHLIDLFS